MMSKSSRSRKNPSRKSQRPRSNAMALRPRVPITTLWSIRGEHKPGFTNSGMRDNLPYRISQITDQGTILTTSSTSDVFYAKSFQASDLDQYSTLASVFDQYKIDSVEVWITPSYQDITGPNPNSYYFTAIDYDDAQNFTSIAQIRQVPNCTDTSSYEGVYRKFVPHSALVSGGNLSVAGNGLANIPATWQDVAYNGVPHFGLKIVAKASNVTTTFSLQTRMNLSFRNVF
jgi:hypothetical protein